MIELPARFKGDGRRIVSALPQFVEEGEHPISVSKAQVAEICAMFVREGRSIHSARCGTLWIVREYCKFAGVQLKIRREGKGSPVMAILG